ncbi:hypothetical protein PFFVO_02626 [Plasmodium falciparum Vietnam Oak-Knoll (FVO)]|uniref:Uncharacterized protein n=1 Tax=Plasmodium falciparum Vietnam Oak-Knoll (FVO) TaxID=1036723 RepID=A0A024V980_PLAFA|nr:hypothetical protein PFFVO_02626 [Plasmodium falciparum Vietnam Oak-Knoll (FVO)]
MLSIASTFGSYFFSSCSVDYLNNESANKFSSYDEKINFRRKRNVSSSSKDDKININNDHDKILNESDDSHDINKNLDNLEYATQNNNKGNIYEEEHIGINNEKEKNIDHHQEVQSSSNTIFGKKKIYTRQITAFLLYSELCIYLSTLYNII